MGTFTKEELIKARSEKTLEVTAQEETVKKEGKKLRILMKELQDINSLMAGQLELLESGSPRTIKK